jgi:hypothetical protein
MELAELQISPERYFNKWTYQLTLWIPSLDSENDSLCVSYRFNSLDVLQELFGREFVLIRAISNIEFKFTLDTTL